MSAVHVLLESEHSKPGRDIYYMFIRCYDSAVSMVFLQGRCTELGSALVTILHVMTNLS